MWRPRVAQDIFTGESPIVGDDGHFEAARQFLANVEEHTNSYGSKVGEACTTLLFSSDSRSTTRIAEKARDRLSPGASLLKDSTREAKDAFRSFAAEVRDIEFQARLAITTTNTHINSLRSAASMIEDIAHRNGIFGNYSWNRVPPYEMPVPDSGPVSSGTVTTWGEMSRKWATALAGIEGQRRLWNGYLDRRKDAERLLLNKLSQTFIGELMTFGSATGGSSVPVIAKAISGEMWGIQVKSLKTSHRLLKGLLGEGTPGENVWESPPNPAVVAKNWATLSPEDQATLISEVPWVIGNLPGLPYDVRDEANRMLIQFYREHPSSLSVDDLRLLSEVQNILDREAREIAKYGAALPPIQLVALNTEGEVPKVAVGYGNLDTASHTTWEVPGMDSDAQNGLAGWDTVSRNLFAAQQEKLVPGSEHSTALVAWLSYDTPNNPLTGDFGVLASDAAKAGAPRLAAELDGNYAARNEVPGVKIAEVPAVINVAAHSYGTTVATIALTQVMHPVDTLTMLGSAGLDTTIVQTLDDLKVKSITPGQKAIFTGHANGDHLAATGAAGAGRGVPNPNAVAVLNMHEGIPVYEGALWFPVEGDASLHLSPTDGHSTIGSGTEPGGVIPGSTASKDQGYFDPGTQSLDTLANITTGAVDATHLDSFTRTEGQSVKVISGHGFAHPIRVPSEP